MTQSKLPDSVIDQLRVDVKYVKYNYSVCEFDTNRRLPCPYTWQYHNEKLINKFPCNANVYNVHRFGRSVCKSIKVWCCYGYYVWLVRYMLYRYVSASVIVRLTVLCNIVSSLKFITTNKETLHALWKQYFARL